MAAAPKPFITPEQYLAIEREAEFKSEYMSGQMFAMAGASPDHVQIVSNLVRMLGSSLRGGPCRVGSSDLRVCVEATSMFTYPDVVVYCGGTWQGNRRDTLLDPLIICEVLSPTTEAYDRGAKFLHYRRLQSLTDYVLVSQDRLQIDHFRRHGEDWVLRDLATADAVLRLEAMSIELRCSDVYEGIDFPSGVAGVESQPG